MIGILSQSRERGQGHRVRPARNSPAARAATTSTLRAWPAATPWTESRSYPSSRSIRRSSSIRHQPSCADPGPAAAAGGRPDVVAAAQWRLRRQPAGSRPRRGWSRQSATIRPAQLKSDATEIPPEVSVLLVHPKQLPEQTLYAIDQFVLRGGKLLAFVDPRGEADSGSDFAATLDGDKSSDLAPLFEAWGLRSLPGKVLGDGAYAMSISLGRDQRPARHPAWLRLAARGAGPGRAPPLPAWKA
ncbi:Gldg family protein [Pseudomonas aeruginosa]